MTQCTFTTLRAVVSNSAAITSYYEPRSNRLNAPHRVVLHARPANADICLHDEKPAAHVDVILEGMSVVMESYSQKIQKDSDSLR